MPAEPAQLGPPEPGVNREVDRGIVWGCAGGGEELGGLRGLRVYHQRLAVQGRSDRLQALAEGAADVAF